MNKRVEFEVNTTQQILLMGNIGEGFILENVYFTDKEAYKT